MTSIYLVNVYTSYCSEPASDRVIALTTFDREEAISFAKVKQLEANNAARFDEYVETWVNVSESIIGQQNSTKTIFCADRDLDCNYSEKAPALPVISLPLLENPTIGHLVSNKELSLGKSQFTSEEIISVFPSIQEEIKPTLPLDIEKYKKVLAQEEYQRNFEAFLASQDEFFFNKFEKNLH